MLSRRSILLISTAFLASGPVYAVAAGRDPIKVFDLDADGTLDLAEVKKAAADLFMRLDPDHDGTLDKTELNSGAGRSLLRLFRSRQGQLSAQISRRGVGANRRPRLVRADSRCPMPPSALRCARPRV